VDPAFPIAADDVLAQPTRARLFALLEELKRPAGTVELAQALELHPNGVRIHLERMEQAQLVHRVRVRQHRGRPPDTGGSLRRHGRVAAPRVRIGTSGDGWPGRSELGREGRRASKQSVARSVESSLQAMRRPASRRSRRR
jgi:DNA-binding transcriptional ArsR family regulator